KGKDNKGAMEIMRKVIKHFALGAIGIDDARPKDDWLFRYPLEWIQALNVATAAESRHRTQQRKFRNDKIYNLRCVDAQYAFAEVESERIRRLVIGDLQNPFVHREHDDLAGAICLGTNVQ